MEMIVLMPIGGKSSRFKNAGYKINKSIMPVTDRFTGKKMLMTLAALKDIPWLQKKSTQLICVGTHEHKHNGLEKKICNSYPETIFIYDFVQLDQAYGCFLARTLLQNNDELFIGACDNGFDIDLKVFEKFKKSYDAIMISHSNDTNIENNPNAHSWALLNKHRNQIKKISLKKTVSKNFMQDHATTGMFWFKNSSVFVEKLEKMIGNKDTLNGKYYLDNLLNYYIRDGSRVGFFDVNYVCWGTPDDYEQYENTLAYWKKFK
jgi:NDP-sugar pyrophosphorylase family protein